MKRMHVNLYVKDLVASTEFYSRFFGAEPTIEKDDYRKWMLDDPFINFSIEPTHGESGIAHLGLQASNEDELDNVYTRIAEAGGPRFEEGETECCYAHSHKSWTSDPDGIIWEAFSTDGQRVDYGAKPDVVPQRSGMQSGENAEKKRCC